jgi:RNA polymerase sigma-70 factor (ECF subfamily)
LHTWVFRESADDPIATHRAQRPGKQHSDEELVGRAVSLQDAAAFGELVRRHQSQVRGCLRRLTRDFARADDLAQETFMRAWEKLPSFAGHGRFLSWLMKLAYNEFLQSARKARRYRAAVERFEAERAVSQSAAVETDNADNSDLDKVLAVLSEEERTVMIMAFGLGLSHGEVCDVTGMPLGTVKSHIHRARQRIQKTFPQRDNDG